MFNKITATIVVLTGLGMFAGQSATAQITADGTIPTVVGSPDGLNFTISGGGRSSSNLFHSFSQFSVPTGGTASFDNAVDVQNIFARVTGGTISNIDGMLSANGTANLFLLNPSGLLFGPNSQLKIGGSFLGSTASSIQFADRTEFSATAPTALLTMSVPIGLQMGQTSGNITVQGQGHQLMGGLFTPVDKSNTTPTLQVNSGKTIALVGQTVTIVDGVLTAENGRIELGGVKAGTVEWNNPTDLQLDYRNATQFGDLVLREQSFLDASGLTSRGMQLQGQNITLQDGSNTLIQTLGSGTPSPIQVNAVGTLDLSGSVQIAPDQGPVTGVTFTRFMTETLGRGQGAGITVTAGNLRLIDGGVVNTRTYGDQAGGNIHVRVAGDIQIDRNSVFNPSITSGIASANFGQGELGNTNVAATNIMITGSGIINSVNFGQGDGGNVTINASGTIKVIGDNPLVAAPSSLGTTVFRQGNGGNLTLNTARLIVEAGGNVATSSLNSGNGGKLTINASESIVVNGQSTKGELSSRISTAVEVRPEVFRTLLGLPDRPKGNAGSLTINTPSLHVDRGAEISVTNQGLGNGGILKINADTVRLDHQGRLIASTDAGTGGNIQLNLQSALLLRHNSQISTQAKDIGNGGNMMINAPIILGLENSDIIANASQGRGGNIDITTQGIIGLAFRNTITPRVDPTNDITASSEFNVNGTVQVKNVGVDPNSGLIALPVDIVDPSQKITQSCQAASQNSSLTMTGRGGTATDPREVIAFDRPWHDLRPVTASTLAVANNTSPKSAVPLLEASAWQVNPTTGQVELMAAQLTAANLQRICH